MYSWWAGDKEFPPAAELGLLVVVMLLFVGRACGGVGSWWWVPV